MKYFSRVNVTNAAVAALTGVLFLAFTYFILEPVVGRSATDEFIVTQTITDEISFLVFASNVAMSPSIGGLTGGYATGTTYFVVRSNSTLGYYVDLGFASTTAMLRTTGTGYINDYSTAGAPADFNYTLNTTSAEFGYTVSASTTSDLDPTFQDNGSNTCGSAGVDTLNKCWMGPVPTSSPERIINRSTPTPLGGATTTIKFKVTVPSYPSPTIPEGSYVATATLTAINN